MTDIGRLISEIAFDYKIHRFHSLSLSLCLAHSLSVSYALSLVDPHTHTRTLSHLPSFSLSQSLTNLAHISFMYDGLKTRFRPGLARNQCLL